MSTAVIINKPQIIVEEKVVLQGISWETYERLMKEHEDRSAPRFTYDQGTLEIYMPTQKHEERSRFFELFVSAVAEEMDLDIRSLGSTTFRKEKVGKGVEPDGCFYLQNAEKIEGNEKVNLDVDPPPDLVIEIDVTSPSLARFPIYAAFGVPEIWLYADETVKIFGLCGKKYVEAKESAVLPKVTSDVLTNFLSQSQTLKRSIWIKNVREWARGLKNK